MINENQKELRAAIRELEAENVFMEEPQFFRGLFLKVLQAQAYAVNGAVQEVTFLVSVHYAPDKFREVYINYGIRGTSDTVPLTLMEFITLKPCHLVNLVQRHYYPECTF